MGHATLAQLKMQGMIAHNQIQKNQGECPYYGEYDFDQVHQDLKIKLAKLMVV